ncbi:MAG: urate hydroxylase PuuD [Candidatus Rokuibacteriota bacterium]
MDAYLLESLNLGLRWFHLAVAIAWIGSSLYFMWLDAALEPPASARPGLDGELWMVHSGGFYHVEKLRLVPGALPRTLHWFRWEAALTWISGVLLLVVVYYLTGGVFLVDPSAGRLGPAAATAVGIGLLVVGWLVYDLLWRSALARDHPAAATTLSYLLLVGAGWAATRLLSGRAAFLHIGAMLGTLMVANVWMHIVPAQRELIAATKGGRAPDWSLGQHAKRRSAHNSYMTFPVIFMMVSNHYPSLYGHRLNWLILALMIVIGGGIRHVMIALEHRRPARWTWAPVAASLLALLYLTWPPRPPATTGADTTPGVPFSVARGIVDLRCLSCHSARPTDDVFRTAPNGVAFDTPDSIRHRAEVIKLRTVTTPTMPPGNKTAMTDEERRLLGHWVDAGARLD